MKIWFLDYIHVSQMTSSNLKKNARSFTINYKIYTAFHKIVHEA
jgi:hypothetical protein